LEVTLNKYTVLRLECGEGRSWVCVEEVVHATLSGFFFNIKGFLHIHQSAVRLL